MLALLRRSRSSSPPWRPVSAPGAAGGAAGRHRGARRPASCPLDLRLHRPQRPRRHPRRRALRRASPVLVLAYYRCPMLCGLTLRGLAAAVGLDLELGKRLPRRHGQLRSQATTTTRPPRPGDHPVGPRARHTRRRATPGRSSSVRGADPRPRRRGRLPLRQATGAPTSTPTRRSSSCSRPTARIVALPLRRPTSRRAISGSRCSRPARAAGRPARRSGAPHLLSLRPRDPPLRPLHLGFMRLGAAVHLPRRRRRWLATLWRAERRREAPSGACPMNELLRRHPLPAAAGLDGGARDRRAALLRHPHDDRRRRAGHLVGGYFLDPLPPRRREQPHRPRPRSRASRSSSAVVRRSSRSSSSVVDRLPPVHASSASPPRTRCSSLRHGQAVDVEVRAIPRAAAPSRALRAGGAAGEAHHDLARRHPQLLRPRVPRQAGRRPRALHDRVVRGERAGTLRDPLHRVLRHRPLDACAARSSRSPPRTTSAGSTPAETRRGAAPSLRRRPAWSAATRASSQRQPGRARRRRRGRARLPALPHLDGTPHIGPTWAGLYGPASRLDGRRHGRRRRGLHHRVDDGPAGQIHLGYPALMPSYLGLIEPAETAAILELIRSLPRPRRPRPRARSTSPGP